MKHATKLLMIVALVATSAPSVPFASQSRTGDVARPTELHASTAGAPAQESWWGAAAGFGCRVGIRYIGSPAFIMFSGFCLVRLLDALIS